jgi:hypothetical protein
LKNVLARILIADRSKLFYSSLDVMIINAVADEWSKRKEKMPVIPSSFFLSLPSSINECMKICQCAIIDIVKERQENS